MTTAQKFNEQPALFPEIAANDAGSKYRMPVIVLDFIRDLGAGTVRVFRIARTIRALNALDDRCLADIGIERTEIPAVAYALANGQVYARTNDDVNDTGIVNKHDPKQPELPLAA